MLADWDTNFVMMSDLLPELQPDFYRDVTAILEAEKIGYALIPGTKYIWCRDYMPVQMETGEFVQFIYDPDYLRFHPRYKTGPIKLPFMKKYRRPLALLDGGNLVTNGTHIIATDKILKGNSKKNLVKELGNHLIIVPTEPFDTVGHSDGILSFLDKDTLSVSDFSEINPEYNEALLDSLSKTGLSIKKMPHYEKVYRLPFRQSAAGCYNNYLRVGNVVLFPTFADDDDYDVAAFNQIKSDLPDCRIHLVYSGKICRRGGLLHCATMNYGLTADQKEAD